MKKAMIIGLVLALCLCFTGCDSKDGMIGSDSSNNLSENISEGMSDLSDTISDGASDIQSNISGGLSDMDPDKNDSGSNNSNNMNSSSNSNNSSDSSKSQPAGTRPAETDFSALSSLDTTKQGWGQGTQVDEYNRPIGALTFQDRYGKYDALYIGKQEKVIHLTFDEGYENGCTGKILDVLRAKKVPAVFFVTHDYCKRNPELVRRMIAEGHTIGNHSMTHPSMPTLTLSDAADEIKGLHEYVQKTFGYNMTLFRPPMGEFSEQTLALTKALGYKSVFWSFAYKDWETDNQPAPSAALKRVTEAKHEGAIYLLHAVSETNTAILGDMIDTLKEDGYRFETL